MMARMLSQLPLLPAGAAEIAPGVGMLAGEDGGLVTVHGLATFAWDAGDEAGRRLAAVQLVRLRAASQAQVAVAFGVDPGTIWRWDQALAAGGVAGLVPARRGPKGASKLTAQLTARIGELDAAGATLREIAAVTGVSTFSVRNALGRVASGGRPGPPRVRERAILPARSLLKPSKITVKGVCARRPTANGQRGQVHVHHAMTTLTVIFRRFDPAPVGRTARTGR
jgi:transposase-like protein